MVDCIVNSSDKEEKVAFVSCGLVCSSVHVKKVESRETGVPGWTLTTRPSTLAAWGIDMRYGYDLIVHKQDNTRHGLCIYHMTRIRPSRGTHSSITGTFTLQHVLMS